MPNDAQSRRNRLARLRKLGLHKGARHLAQPPPKPRPTDLPSQHDPVPLHFLPYQDDLQHAAPIEHVMAGQVVRNEHGAYFSFEARYPLNAPYGKHPLSRLLETSMHSLARVTNDERWLELQWDEVLFIDTETTGLQIAAGTVAFLIGVGFVDGNDFVVRQVFMRDFHEEMALLQDLAALCDRYQALVSFNGKTFDIPLLENRFVLARLFPALLDGPHFDLLHPSRRVWRRRLENCRLATLETDVLGVIRTGADIPGYFIPSLYRKYLVDHDARAMAGIFYHNEMDIVSMAALAAELGQLLSLPQSHLNGHHPDDVVSVGLWLHQLGQIAQAQETLQLGLELEHVTPAVADLARLELATLLKRQGRTFEASQHWQLLAMSSQALPALEELAKYYEWQMRDFESALKCVSYALRLLQEGAAARNPVAAADWEHRWARLQRRLSRQVSDNTDSTVAPD